MTEKQLSTVSNPLVLTYKGGYYVNKPGDQTGEYVSKEVAQEMLEAIQSALRIKDLWRMPENYPGLGGGHEHLGESSALALMQSAFESVIQKNTQP